MNVRVDLDSPIRDGMEVKFKSPCDASEVTGLNIYYPVDGVLESQNFAFADANATDVGHIDALFAKDAVVKVILDLDTNMAFVQNADTNAYLEGRFDGIEESVGNINDRILPVMVSAKGVFVRANDTANLPIHALALTDYEENLNTVNVSVYGKNLANINVTQRKNNGMTYKWENSTLTIWGTSTNTSGAIINPYGTTGDVIILLPAGTYTASTINAFSQNVRIQIGKRINGSFSSISNIFGADPSNFVTFTLNESTLIVFRMFLSTGVVIDESTPDVVSLQIEAGSTATGFETPMPPQTATIDTATQTGWENLRTHYGTTTIIPESGMVECTYVADTKLYVDNKINELTNAIIALGGNV